MDILRAALGDAKLNYLGKSYGTYLGTVYADLFPKLVGQFVLDGVVPPDLTSAQVNEGQAAGFEVATRPGPRTASARAAVPSATPSTRSWRGCAASSRAWTPTPSHRATPWPLS